MRLRRPPSLLLNAALGALALTGVGWAYVLVTDPAVTPARSATSRTVPVSQGAVVASVSATGSVQSATTATADFATAGTVTVISAKVGDSVAKGHVLAKVDPAQAQAQLATAEANLTAAQASLTRATKGTDDAAIAAAQAQVTSAQASVDDAQRTLAGTVLKAPMAGTVTAVNGSVGASASAGSAAGGNAGGFIQLADLHSLQVQASFAEADATRLTTGQPATVTWAALPGATSTAKIVTIAPTASTTNNVNSYAVMASLATLPAGVRIGQTVTVRVTVAEADNAIRVPAAAVATSATRHTVTVVVNGSAQTRVVDIGIEGDTFTQILSGLAVGDQVQIITSASATTGGLPGLGGFGGGGLPGGGLGGGGVGGGGPGQGGGGNR